MKKKKQNSRFFRVCYLLLAGLLKLIFRIRVINPENEPDEGGYLISSNHVSAVDAIVLAVAFGKNQAHLMGKKELFKIPFLRGLIKLLGAFPVDRSGSDVGAIKKAIGIIRDGGCVGIFPQGHRHPSVDPRTTPVKNGAALICRRAECGVMPVYILRKNNKHRMFRKTYLIMGEFIPNATLMAEGENAEVTSRIFDEICKLGENAVKSGKYKL